ncbi:LamG domain-containing protein [Flavobacterium sp. HJSW_4]|uniref:LamG domain-containing protein n=1 Tax=Flavobacterium sp. HJSW_4 TaxID=3344660 RepID=UPI0035F2F862
MIRNYLAYLVFFNLAILQAQKQNVFQFDKDLILYLPLNGNLEDQSSLKNNTNSGGLVPEKDRFGIENGAFSFSKNGYLSVLNVNNFNGLKAFTLSGWVYLDNYREHNTIISKVSPNRDFNLQISNEGYLNFHYAYNYGYTHFYSKNKIPKNKWVYIAFAFDGKAFKMYINGKPEKFIINQAGKDITEKDLIINFLWTGENLTIGNLYADGGENLFGKIDEIRIYKKGLSASEIQQLYKEKDFAKESYSLGVFNDQKQGKEDQSPDEYNTMPAGAAKGPIFQRMD